MEHIIDQDRYPLERSDGKAYSDLVAHAQAALQQDGLFNLPGFLAEKALAQTLEHLRPRLATESFHHARWHNIYFKDTVEGLDPNDPALRKLKTSNHTLCHDQVQNTPLDRLYTWQPFIDFMAKVVGRGRLYRAEDPLSGVNVMEYRAGEALNWHFDRSYFTTTLLLQRPDIGGAFEYVQDLRSDTDPNHKGIAEMLRGTPPPKVLEQEPGTLNVFLGQNTAHRVTPPEGTRPRIVAVFSYYDQPGVRFSAQEQLGFYGRVGQGRP